MNISVVILAAGLGRRMKASYPKVLHPLAGKTMLHHVIDTARALKPAQIHVIYGHQGEQLKAATTQDTDISWVHQSEQLGTAHAIKMALPRIPDDHHVLVLSGDVPLLQATTLTRLIEQTPSDHLGILTAVFADPSGLGRIIRDENKRVLTITEHNDASELQKQIQEIYSGIMLVSKAHLTQWLPQLNADNAQSEYYLTEIVSFAAKEQCLSAYITQDPEEVLGVNSKAQLASLERIYQARMAKDLLAQGVHFYDPSRFDLRGELTFGEDLSVDVNVILSGYNHIGSNVRIGANCYLHNVRIGDNVTIHPFSTLEDAIIENNCQVGPYARLRPGAKLEQDAKVGNFVEMKNTTLGKGSKASHLSYLGDAQIGNQVNIGAGTITCNYDGANKHQTIIQDDVFIGSNTSLVAPIKVGKSATVGAGGTITKDVPEQSLAVARSVQKIIDDYERPKKTSN